MTLTQISTNGIKDANVNTADIADDAVTTAKIATSAISEAKLGTGVVTTAKIAASAVGTYQIADQAVTLAKLPHGTSSNDGKFLRANNGADPTFETVTGTTINQNGSDRVITGSSTANNLNGQANFTYNGDTVGITRSGNSAGGLSITNTNNTQASAHARLEVSGGDNASAIMRMECNGHSNEFIADGNGNLRVDDNGTERMRLDSSGKVLIGTTTPAPYSTRLLTVGDTSFNNTAIEIRSSSSTGRLYFTDSDSAGVGAYMGAVQYHHTDDSMKFETGGGTVRLRVDSDGLKFGSDTAAANALDDYEEGSFTPVLQNDGSTTYHTQNGKYTKIGNRVYFNVYIKINQEDGSSGSATGINLPFQNDFGSGVVTGMITGNDHWDSNFGTSNMSGWMGNGNSNMSFYKNSGQNLQAITVNDIGNSGEIAIAGHYPTNS